MQHRSTLFVFFASLLMIFLFSACNNSDEQATPTGHHPSPLEKSIEGKTFYGVLPCASCPGIETRIVLEDNHNVTFETLYQENDTFPTLLKGVYEVKDSILTLTFANEENNKSYKIKSDTLIAFLNQDGEEVQEMASFYQLHTLTTFDPENLEGIYTQMNGKKKGTHQIKITYDKDKQAYTLQFTSESKECNITASSVTLNTNRLMLPLNTLNKELKSTLTITVKGKDALVYINDPKYKSELSTLCKDKHVIIGTYVKS